MAMGKRERERQQDLFIATDQLPKSDGHVFYRRLNSLLAESRFDDFVEELCRGYYKEDGPGRPSIPPGVYFRMLIVGYFEGIDSHRGIAWRCNDSLSLRDFLGTPLSESTPDHSTLSRTRGRLPLEVHERMFQFILKIAADKKLLSAKTVGVDSTMLEANAAMKSIVRKDTGEDYRQYLLKLALEAGIENPTDEELRRFDKNRKDKTCSNDDWESPDDPEAKIAKMKDGRTHLAYKAEHVVDLESEFILAATVCPATWGDAETLIDSVNTAQHNVDLAAAMNMKPPVKVGDHDCNRTAATITEVAADKGYHKASTLELAEAMDLRTYIPERKKKHKAVWTDKPDSYRKAVVANRRRVRRKKGRQLQRRRSERVERSFAHVCNTGGARRCWLRGVEKINKRYLIVTAARNLGLIMLKLFGIGKPRKLQKGEDDSIRVLALIWTHWRLLNDHVVTFGRRIAQFLPAAASPPPARPAFAFAA